jgi:uncharacterized protein YqhQ
VSVVKDIHTTTKTKELKKKIKITNVLGSQVQLITATPLASQIFLHVARPSTVQAAIVVAMLKQKFCIFFWFSFVKQTRIYIYIWIVSLL